jgi:hypothetical protein
MAYYAKLQDNIVQQIIVVSDTIDDGASWCNQTFGGQWVECNDGAVGWTYSDGAFVAPQPYASWTLDSNYDWQPPTPYPTDGETYYWNEEELAWAGI